MVNGIKEACNTNKTTHVTTDEINNYFSQYVDERSIKKIHNMLMQRGLPDSDITVIMFCVAATCAKHYSDGYEVGNAELLNRK